MVRTAVAITKMRLLLAAAALLVSPLAHAGKFGGFSADETRYLDGERVCSPIAKPKTRPECRDAGAAERDQLRFAKPSAERGGARFSASAAGTRIEVRDPAGKVVRSFDAGDVISRVQAVYRSPGSKLLAVEYQARVMGRVVEDVVGFTLPGAAKPPEVAQPAQPAVPTKPTVLPPPRDKTLEAGLARARAQLKKKQYRAAKAAYDKLAARHPEDPAVIYGQAAARAALGEAAEALTRLEALGAMSHAEAPVWLVEARTDPAWTALRAEPRYRAVLGLDGKGREPSAYERALGLGGTWEQAGSACEEPTIVLELGGRGQSFQLVIKSDCQGVNERTKLDGRWLSQGSRTLQLIFPNPGQDDEVLACSFDVCSDGTGEMCLDCGAGTDMAFTLRPVRR